MVEHIFKAKCKFLYSGKTYKRGEIILRDSRSVPKEFKMKTKYKGQYHG